MFFSMSIFYLLHDDGIYINIYIYTYKGYIYVSYSIAYLYPDLVINEHFCWSYPLYIKIWSWYIFSLDLKILDPWNWDGHGSFKKFRTPKSKVIQKTDWVYLEDNYYLLKAYRNWYVCVYIYVHIYMLYIYVHIHIYTTHTYISHIYIDIYNIYIYIYIYIHIHV